MELTNIGKRIRILRRSKNISQKKLAKDLDLTTNFISMLENGKCLASFRTLNNITKRLGIPLDVFFLLLIEPDSENGIKLGPELAQLQKKTENLFW